MLFHETAQLFNRFKAKTEKLGKGRQDDWSMRKDLGTCACWKEIVGAVEILRVWFWGGATWVPMEVISDETAGPGCCGSPQHTRHGSD